MEEGRLSSEKAKVCLRSQDTFILQRGLNIWPCLTLTVGFTLPRPSTEDIREYVQQQVNKQGIMGITATFTVLGKSLEFSPYWTQSSVMFSILFPPLGMLALLRGNRIILRTEKRNAGSLFCFCFVFTSLTVASAGARFRICAENHTWNARETVQWGI